MEKLPNTLEKLLNKQRKIKYTRKGTISRVIFSILGVFVLIMLVITFLMIGGVI